MKTIQSILTLIICLISFNSFGQIDLSQYVNVNGVHVTTFWGDITATGTSNTKSMSLEVTFTDTSKTPININDIADYVNIEEIDNTLYIKARQPKGFESIDFKLYVPQDKFLDLKLLKGGEIYASNFINGIEVNSLNGSVKLNNIGDYALVNAANGEVQANFKQLDNTKPISLVTMNGGVTVELPKKSKRDLRLISRKNGYVSSDFKLDAKKTIANLNVKRYSKAPIINTATINGGGALLFMSTENGPLTIKSSKK